MTDIAIEIFLRYTFRLAELALGASRGLLDFAGDLHARTTILPAHAFPWQPVRSLTRLA